MKLQQFIKDMKKPNWLFKFFNKHPKQELTEQLTEKPTTSHCKPTVVRVLDFDSLLRWKYCNFAFWKSETIQDPKIIGKIFELLRTASVIRLYITKNCIEYSANTKKHGLVCGSCSRGSRYMFFEFGLSRSGHRFDIYGEDRRDPTIKAFYEWWGNLVKPYEDEFDNDYNL